MTLKEIDRDETKRWHFGMISIRLLDQLGIMGGHNAFQGCDTMRNHCHVD